MGRDAGWIAITSGIAGGADVIFVPEKPIDIDQAVKILKERHDRGKLFSIVVVAEGAKLPGTTSRRRRELRWTPSVTLASVVLPNPSQN